MENALTETKPLPRITCPRPVHVLVAGASRGLGLALCRSYATLGCKVIASARNPEAEGIRTLTTQFGDRILPIRMDVADSESVAAALQQVQMRVPSLDVIICNAGVHAADSMAPLDSVGMSGCLDTYNVNTLGPLRVAQAFMPMLEAGEWKVLASISSESGSISGCQRTREFDYCMSKAALNMQCKMLQNAGVDKGVKVLAIHPGWIRTDMGGEHATFAVDDAADNVVRVIAAYRGKVHGPVFVDYEGNELEW